MPIIPSVRILLLHVPNDYQSYGGISRGVVLEELGEAYLSWIHFTPFLRKDEWYGKAEICVRNLSSGRLDGSVEVEIGKNSFAVLPIVLEGEEEKAFPRRNCPVPGRNAGRRSHRCFI